MRYIDFKDLIAAELRQTPAGLSWSELKNRLQLTYQRPCATWIRRLEHEIGLVRVPQHGHTYCWRIKDLQSKSGRKT